MQPVPIGYSPYPDSRWSDFRVTFRMIDTDAKDDATPGATGTDTELSQIEQVIDGVQNMSGPWATWETDGFPLDGSVSILPDDITPYQSGWWSTLSGEDCLFDPPPVLSFDFSGPHSVVGITLYFDDATPQYPAEIKLTYKDGADAVVAERVEAVNDVVHVVEIPGANFQRIEIAFLKTHKPYQSARVCSILFGVIKQFSRKNAVSMSLVGGVSPAAESLESTTLTVVFDNTDKRYNLANPSGIYAYLQDGQELEVEVGVGESRADLHYVNAGKLFFTSAQAEDNAMTAQITANDPFLPLDASVCNIGTSGTWTLAQAVAAIISDSGLDITYLLPEPYASRVIRKCIPQGTSHRESLRMAVQAARCTCWFDRENTLVFGEVISSSPVETVSGDIMPTYPQATVSERINTVVVTAYDEYTEDNELEFTASNIQPGEYVRAISIDNPLVNDSTVADWILAIKQRRVNYVIYGERGNPAREVGDTVAVVDAYGNTIPAIQTRFEIKHDGSLSANGVLWGYV